MAKTQRDERAGLRPHTATCGPCVREPHPTALGRRRKFGRWTGLCGPWICETSCAGVYGVCGLCDCSELASCMGLGEVVGVDAGFGELGGR